MCSPSVRAGRDKDCPIRLTYPESRTRQAGRPSGPCDYGLLVAGLDGGRYADSTPTSFSPAGGPVAVASRQAGGLGRSNPIRVTCSCRFLSTAGLTGPRLHDGPLLDMANGGDRTAPP